MFKSRLLASVALAALCLPVAALSPGVPLGVSIAQAQTASVSFQLFFDQLEPHGVWVRHAQYNYVFCPTGVDASWRPYTTGRWLYLEDRGWYFASDEPFAWATYHYGRWFADQTLGWCWVPGTKWAPAWVSWRRSDNVVGWAPLPPENDDYAVAIEISRRELPEGYWVFVPTEQFVEPDLSVSIVFGSDQPDYFAQTQFLGPVVVEGDMVVNNVIEVTYIEQVINQQVIVYQAEPAAEPSQQAVDIDAQALVIFDQDVAEPTEEVAPPEPIEEADAAATIETEGGTAGATADLTVEAGAEATTPEAPAADQPADAAAPAEPGTEQPADAPATSEPATQPADGAEAPAVAPADPAQPTPPAADAATPAQPTEPAAADPAAAPAEGDDALCPPETMVDGKCPPVPGQSTTEPAADAPAPASEPEPAPDAAPAPEAAPATDAPAPAPDAETAPTAEPAAEDGAAQDVPKKPLCPPETMVDGKCPVKPGEPATP
jgi:hypothetical protein